MIGDLIARRHRHAGVSKRFGDARRRSLTYRGTARAPATSLRQHNDGIVIERERRRKHIQAIIRYRRHRRVDLATPRTEWRGRRTISAAASRPRPEMSSQATASRRRPLREAGIAGRATSRYQAAGTAPVGNDASGVFVSFASSNIIGGSVNEAGNVIAFNARGVTIFGTSSDATNNTVRLNSIFSNAGIGIELFGNEGTDANDPLDADTAARTTPDQPVLDSAVSSGGAIP